MQSDALTVAARRLPKHIRKIELESRAGGKVHHGPGAHLGLHLTHLKGRRIVLLDAGIGGPLVKARRGPVVIGDAVAHGHHDGIALEPVADVSPRRADELLHRDLHLLQISDGRRRQVAVPLDGQAHHHQILGTLRAVRLARSELVLSELREVAARHAQGRAAQHRDAKQHGPGGLYRATPAVST